MSLTNNLHCSTEVRERVLYEAQLRDVMNDGVKSTKVDSNVGKRPLPTNKGTPKEYVLPDEQARSNDLGSRACRDGEVGDGRLTTSQLVVRTTPSRAFLCALRITVVEASSEAHVILLVLQTLLQQSSVGVTPSELAEKSAPPHRHPPVYAQ